LAIELVMRERNPQTGRIRVEKYSSSRLEVYQAGRSGQGIQVRVDMEEIELRAIAMRGEKRP
jgi:hypothetical protein